MQLVFDGAAPSLATGLTASALPYNLSVPILG